MLPVLSSFVLQLSYPLSSQPPPLSPLLSRTLKILNSHKEKKKKGNEREKKEASLQVAIALVRCSDGTFSWLRRHPLLYRWYWLDGRREGVARAVTHLLRQVASWRPAEGVSGAYLSLPSSFPSPFSPPSFPSDPQQDWERKEEHAVTAILLHNLHQSSVLWSCLFVACRGLVRTKGSCYYYARCYYVRSVELYILCTCGCTE